MGSPFPYAARAREAEDARRALHEATAKWRLDRSEKSHQTWQAAIDRFHTQVGIAYPPNFWRDFERLRAGDADGLESAIEFLEADPMFFRSGYVKAELLGLINRFPLTHLQVDRLREAVSELCASETVGIFGDFAALLATLTDPSSALG